MNLRHLVAFLMLPSIPALADSFMYQLHDYPVSMEQCIAQREVLQTTMRDQAGVEFVKAVCSPRTNATVDVEFFYEAPQRLSLVSTLDTPIGYDFAYSYRDMATCMDALEAETALFTQETSLTPFVAYCQTDRSGTFETPVGARIEAFGTAIKVPQISGFHLFTKPFTQTYLSILNEVSAGFRDHGIAVAGASIRSEFPAARVAVRYYLAQRIALTVNDYSLYKTKDDCVSDLGRIRSLFFTDGYGTASLFCGTSDILGGAELSGLFIGRDGLTTKRDSSSFNTFPDCTAALASKEEVYRDGGHEVLGSLCGLNENRNAYNVLILTP